MNISIFNEEAQGGWLVSFELPNGDVRTIPDENGEARVFPSASDAARHLVKFFPAL